MSYTLHLDNEQVQKLIEKYRSFSEPPVNNYTLFRAKYNSSIITIYKTNTVLVQGKTEDETELYNEICDLLSIEPSHEEAKSTKTLFQALQSNIGTDEVGTGDFFGGIVVAGAFVSKDMILEVKKLGVKDSKELSDNKIVAIAPQLMKMIPYRIQILDNLKFNYLVSHAKYNMNHIKALMHNYICYVMKKNIPDYDSIIIDAFTTRQNYFNYLKGEKTIVEEVILEEKAENKFISVACASIIARYTFLKHIDDLSSKVGFELPKGAGKPVDTAILKLYTEKGVSIFKDIAKLNFKNFDKYRVNK